MINKQQRVAAASLVVSASVLIGIAMNEGYRENAYLDTVGVPTIGFGETKDVKLGQRTTPIRAMMKLQESADAHAKGMVKCIHVPITQNEFDAYLDFTYNVGVGAFCGSTLNKKLNAGDYEGACKEILKWVKQPELAGRRQKEYATCLGQ